jgi:ATP-dependent RNA helicase DOB1
VSGLQLTPEDLIKRSFRQFQMRRMVPHLKQRLAQAKAAMNAIEVPMQEHTEELFYLLQEREQVHSAMASLQAQPQHSVPFLQPGRLVRLSLPPLLETETMELEADPKELPQAPQDWEIPKGEAPAAWAAVLSFERLASNLTSSSSEAEPLKVAANADEALNATYIVDVIACVRAAAAPAGKATRRALLQHDDPDGIPLVVAVPLSQITALGAPRVFLPKQILTQEARCVRPT